MSIPKRSGSESVWYPRSAQLRSFVETCATGSTVWWQKKSSTSVIKADSLSSWWMCSRLFATSAGGRQEVQRPRPHDGRAATTVAGRDVQVDERERTARTHHRCLEHERQYRRP